MKTRQYIYQWRSNAGHGYGPWATAHLDTSEALLDLLRMSPKVTLHTKTGEKTQWRRRALG